MPLDLPWKHFSGTSNSPGVGGLYINTIFQGLLSEIYLHPSDIDTWRQMAKNRAGHSIQGVTYLQVQQSVV